VRNVRTCRAVGGRQRSPRWSHGEATTIPWDYFGLLSGKNFTSCFELVKSIVALNNVTWRWARNRKGIVIVGWWSRARSHSEGLLANYVLKVFCLCKLDPLISKSLSLQLRHAINQIKQVIHPNIARVLQMSQHFDHIHKWCKSYAVVGISGISYQTRSRSEIVDIVKNILQGLQSFHDHNLVFWNLNLETLMFANDRKVKLTNYGLSRKIFKNELQLIKEDHWEALYDSSPES